MSGRGGGRGGGGRGGGGRGSRGGRGRGEYDSLAPTSPLQLSAQQGSGRGAGSPASSEGRGARGSYHGGREGRVVDPCSSSSSSVPSGVTDLGSQMESLSTEDPVGAVDSVSSSASASVATPALPAAPPVSSKAVRPPRRPGYGTIGKKCVIRANHFLVEIADKDLYHYDVAITPEVISKGVNRAVIKLLIDMYSISHLGCRKPAYDGRKSLYTAGSLPFNAKEFVVKLPDKDQEKARREREFKVTIKFVGRADLQHLRQFLQGRQYDIPQETIQALDVVLKESPATNYVTVGRSFFSPKLGPIDPIGDGMECWKGYYQSLRPTQMGLSLNIDVAATSFYKPIMIVDFAKEYLSLRDIPRRLSDPDRIKLKKAVRGLKVETTHLANSRRRYRITGITTDPLNQLSFPNDQGGTTSVVQYFKEKYGIALKQVTWPALQAGSDTRPAYLPMEVCKIVEGQKFSKKLNERQVTAILRLTCKRPIDREHNIAEMVKHNNYGKDEYASEFGIRITDRLVTLDARVLPPPMLKYHETGREAICRPNSGQWNMINKRMVDGARVDYWACLNFSRLNNEAASSFCWELVSMCKNIGMTFGPTPLLPTCTARPDNIQRVLVEVNKQSIAELAKRGIVGKQLQLLIIILPDVTGSYGRIKRICETELGIVSQCCKPNKISRNDKQYFENVSLKINVKAGGRNTVLSDAIQKRIPLVTDLPTIIFGADVTHPRPGEDSVPSIAAVVASMDWPEITKYRGLVSAQPQRQEVIKDLYIQNPREGVPHGGMIRELLISYWKTLKLKPSRIIFYRDGVSEGQFNEVLLNEVTAIRKACQSLQEDYLPPITFVVVQKRHHTRLFPSIHNDRQTTDRSGNILAGTVVDTKICHPTEFDFYLCSHAGIQGTSRPAHYHVLYDENRFSADGLQSLTNNLCYTYARCTRSVSIVPPAYYAHLAAFRATYYIEGETSDAASNVSGGAAVRHLPTIKGNVQDVMFYC